MGRKTGRDGGLRPMSDRRITAIMEGERSEETDIFKEVDLHEGRAHSVRLPRNSEQPKRPIDEWPISTDTFKELARISFERSNPKEQRLQDRLSKKSRVHGLQVRLEIRREILLMDGMTIEEKYHLLDGSYFMTCKNEEKNRCLTMQLLQ